MPQRLRDLSQQWGQLAVRGFEQSAQAQIDKNNRQAGVISGAANAIGSAIVRKKGRDRQDKMLADERARDDALRAERYGREDARHKIEDKRHEMSDQMRRDSLVLQYRVHQKAELLKKAQAASTPEDYRAVAQEISDFDMGTAQIASRVYGQANAQSPAPVAPVGASETTVGVGAPTSAAKPAGRTMPPRAPAPVLPPSVLPTDEEYSAAVAKAGLPPEAQKAFDLDRAATAATARRDRLNEAAKELAKRAETAKNTGSASWPQLMARHRALLDQAEKANQEASYNKQESGAWEAKAKQAQAQAGQQREASEVLRAAMLDGVPQETIQSWVQQGITDPAILRTLWTGAKKPEKDPKAPKLTPEQEAAEQASKESALVKERGAKGLDPATGKPPKPVVDGEAKWQEEQSEKGLTRYSSMTNSAADRKAKIRWEEFTSDELAAVANNESIDPSLRDKFREALFKRHPAPGAMDRVNATVERGMLGGEQQAPAPMDVKAEIAAALQAAGITDTKSPAALEIARKILRR